MNDLEAPQISTATRYPIRRRESLLMNLGKCFFLVLAFAAFVWTVLTVARGGSDVTLAAGSAVACFFAIVARIMQAEQFRP